MFAQRTEQQFQIKDHWRLNHDTQCLVSDYELKRAWLLGLTVDTARVYTRSKQTKREAVFLSHINAHAENTEKVTAPRQQSQIWTQIDRANMLWYSLDYADHQQLSKMKRAHGCASYSVWARGKHTIVEYMYSMWSNSVNAVDLFVHICKLRLVLFWRHGYSLDTTVVQAG